jgi:N-acetylmuramic acid 6-phosphate (MurNAc-6-P) etherase
MRTTPLKDLQQQNNSANDVVVGIAASGTTPYVNWRIRSVQQIILLQEVFPVMQAPLKPHSSYRRSSGSRVCNGSSRMKAEPHKISVKHDFDRHNDNQQRKQNGRHATK